MNYSSNKRLTFTIEDQLNVVNHKRQRIAPPREDYRKDSEVAGAGRGEFRPAMLSFKAFLVTQDDNITDDEALIKFSEYKKEFNRQQLNEFFVAHKDEEWIKEKYHPDYIENSLSKQKKGTDRRLKVFMDFYNEGIIDKYVLQADKVPQIELLLDSFVANLEDSERLGLLIDQDDPDRETLCKTRSLYLSTVHPHIERDLLNSLLKKYPGFRRLCLSDPSPESKWKRRGWATFSRDAKIKEICFNISNVRLKESELCPILNKDLTRRVRSVEAVSNDKSLLRSSLQLATQLVSKLDSKWGFWDTKENELLGNVESLNPLLINISEYLVEDMSAEEELLLGCPNQNLDLRVLETDSEMALVLDRLVLYLKLVHCLDFYNCTHYATEDEMPNRCGLFHVRDSITSEITITEKDKSNFLKKKSEKIMSLMKGWLEMPEKEMIDLGSKNDEDALEMFSQSNIEELGNNKNLCKICGKKFKGTEFVKKHILNKHEDGTLAVKKEVLFYNNYIKDRKRPALPERPNSPVQPVIRPMDIRPIFSRIQDKIEQNRHKGSIKDRLGYKKNKIAARDPRSVVDYSDVEFSDIFD